MDIYKLRCSGEEWPVIDATDEEHKNLYREFFDGKPLASSWSPIQMDIIRRRRKLLPDSDFWLLVPVFKERAIQVLGDMLTANGELLPLNSEQGPLFAYNVLTVIDGALDEERSELNRFSNGAVMNIYRYEFRPDRVQGATVFKIPQSATGVYATDTFVKRAEEAALTGIQYARVWSDSGT